MKPNLIDYLAYIINSDTINFNAKVDGSKINVRDRHHNELVIYIKNNQLASLIFENEDVANTVELNNVMQIGDYSSLLMKIYNAIIAYNN